MIFKKIIVFSMFLLYIVPVTGMKTKPQSDLPGNPSKRLKMGDTRSLHEIYETGDINAFLQSLQDGANPNEIGPRGDAILLTTQLGNKFNNEDKTRAFEALRLYGADVNALIAFDPHASDRPYRYGLIHLAAGRGDQEFLELYLRGGVDPNLRDTSGRTALWYAKDQKMMNILLRAGTDAAARDSSGQQTALFAVAGRDPIRERQAEELIIRDPHIVIKKDVIRIGDRDYPNRTAYEDAKRGIRYREANPELENEETSRKIIEWRVFPHMGKTINPGPVGGTIGFVRNRETGKARFTINQLQPDEFVIPEPATPFFGSMSSAGSSWSSNNSEKSSDSDE